MHENAMTKSFIERDSLLTLYLTKYIISTVTYLSRYDSGEALDMNSIYRFYVTGDPGLLTEAQQEFVRGIIEHCEHSYTDILSKAIEKFGGEHTREVAATVAGAMWEDLPTLGGTKGKAG